MLWVRLSKEKSPEMAKRRGWEKVNLKKMCVDKLYGNYYHVTQLKHNFLQRGLEGSCSL